MEVPLGVGRTHPNLTFMIQIAPRDSDRTIGLQHEIVFLLHLVRDEAISDPARNHDVIFCSIAEFPENTFQDSATLEDKDDLIRAAVAIILKLIVGLFRPRPIGNDILVEKHGNAPGVNVAAPRNVSSPEMVMAQRAVGNLL